MFCVAWVFRPQGVKCFKHIVLLVNILCVLLEMYVSTCKYLYINKLPLLFICLYFVFLLSCSNHNTPDSKVYGANMGPIWGRQDPGGPHIGPVNFAVWEWIWPSCTGAIGLKHWTHWGRDKMTALSQTTFSNTFLWTKIVVFSLQFCRIHSQWSN